MTDAQTFALFAGGLALTGLVAGQSLAAAIYGAGLATVIYGAFLLVRWMRNPE